MARHIDCRIKIEGTLITTTPLSVGQYGDGLVSDAPFAKDGDDEFYIPGTALAGPIRAYMERYYPETDNKGRTIDRAEGCENVRKLFGFQPAKGETDKTRTSESGETSINRDGAASLIYVEDMPLVVKGYEAQQLAELWDGVGIHRWTQTAVDGAKFDRVVLPINTELRLNLSVELPPNTELRPYVWEILRALKQGDISLGAAGTRGLGGVKLVNCTWTEEDYTTRDGLLKVLRGTSDVCYSIEHLDSKDSAVVESIKRPKEYHPANIMTLALFWRPIGPLMVQSAQEGNAVHSVPFVSRTDAINSSDPIHSLVIPGSSIKGAFRTHAERIMRTLGVMKDAPSATNSSSDPSEYSHADQITTCGLINALFGAATLHADDDTTESVLPRNQKAALAFETVYEAQPALTKSLFDNLLDVTRPGSQAASKSTASEFYSAIKAFKQLGTHGQRWDVADHVAIDRWTGGAADGQLYSAIEPYDTEWKPIHIVADFDRLCGDSSGADKDSANQALKERQDALALLILLIRDFAAGRIPLGYGVNRGYGAVEFIRCEIKTTKADFEDLHSWNGVKLLRKTFQDSPGTAAAKPLSALTKHWSQSMESINVGER